MAGLWPFGRSSAPRAAAARPATPAALKRERRVLLREREQLVRDLGGIVYEMFRLDRFRVEVVTARCRALVELDERLDHVEELLAGARRRGARCECGAPIPWGSHFCQNCGRPVGPQPVVSCARCGSPLAADVRFCGTCGSAVEFGSGAAVAAPALAEAPADTLPGGDAEPEPEPVAGRGS